MYISWDKIEDFIICAFVKLGVPEEDAAICADILIESDKRGIESHGVNRFKPIYVDRIIDGILNPVTEFEVVRKPKPQRLLTDITAWEWLLHTRQ